MCGIVGFVNYKQNLIKYKQLLINMNNSLSRRGPDEEGYYLREHVALAHKRLIVIDPHGGKQPMVQNGTILGTKQNRSQMCSAQNRTGPKCTKSPKCPSL